MLFIPFPQETSCYMQVIYNTIRKEDAGPVRSDSVDSPTPKVPGKSVQAEIHRLRSQLLATARKKPGSNNVWFGMLQYLKGVTKEEADAFLYNLLPRVIEMALGIEECRPDEGLRLSQQQAGELVYLYPPPPPPPPFSLFIFFFKIPL